MSESPTLGKSSRSVPIVPVGDAGASAPPPDELAAFREIVEGTAHATGEQFFQALVRHLAGAIDVHYAFLAEFADSRTRVRTLAYWERDHIAQNIEFDLAGTPCEEVVTGRLCHHPRGVKESFPADEGLVGMGIESYLGVPLRDSNGEVLGHLAVFDERPMPDEPRKLMIFHIFASRAAAELARLRVERELRDLYEEAPIAYVKEDLDSRFISANRAALRILGVKPEEVPEMRGLSLVPDTPDAQRRAQEAFASIGRGTDTSGVVLELRRKDNGAPVWIQWWSKPEPDGKYTRTMFVDITAQVLAEAERNRLQRQNVYLQEEIKSLYNFDEIIGESPALRGALENVRRVAPTDATVLIVGETGTGKELVARAIHSHSRRRDKPLIKLNCAALPTHLVESELFGHEKGAFTGATARRQGRFELADGGTIFLDEIGELPPDAQAKLLRVLQEKEFERVGGSQPIRVDVRLIAATNRDLAKSIQERTFREDLYYRLNVFPLRLPPLRERPGDIRSLVSFFLQRFTAQVGKSVDQIDADTLSRLEQYAWPGNVRELENVIQRAVILSSGDTLEIPAEVFGTSQSDGSAAADSASSGNLEAIQRKHIQEVLERVDWVIEGPSGAAKVLGLHPNTLRSRMKKLGIERPSE